MTLTASDGHLLRDHRSIGKMVTVAIFMTSSIWNCVIYNVRNRDFRSATRSLISKLKSPMQRWSWAFVAKHTGFKITAAPMGQGESPPGTVVFVSMLLILLTRRKNEERIAEILLPLLQWFPTWPLIKCFTKFNTTHKSGCLYRKTNFFGNAFWQRGSFQTTYPRGKVVTKTLRVLNFQVF